MTSPRPLLALAADVRPFLSGLKGRVSGRRARRVLLLAAGLMLLAHPVARAASDVFSNVGPASQLAGGSLADRYPLGSYALDHHFTGASASLTGGIDVSGVPALIAYFLADIVWQLTAFLANALITVFTFAFSLDLVNGSQATGGAGALAPVSAAVRGIYSTTFGAPWLVIAVVLAGLWAMWKALVQRRYTETAGALGLSLVFVVIALAFVTQPEQTIGRASRWSNDMSAAFLSLSSSGSVGNEQSAKQQASDQLFHLLVYQPWTVLDFGGLEHCVKTPVNGSSPQSVPVRPLSGNPSRDAALSQQLQSASEVQADGKLCVNNEIKYAPHFLAYPPESDDRNAEYDALSNGDSSKLPDSDPAKHSGSYQLSAADKPAADAMGKGGQYQRLLLAVVIFAGELGAFLLLGTLSIAVILAQVLVLLLLAFAPVALVIGVYPGRGHDFFRGWLSRLATFLLRKAIYSLILAVLLAVAAAVGDAASNLGWLLSFGLEAAFFWAVFLYRHQLTGQLAAATTGTAVRPEDATLRLTALYAATRIARRALPQRHATHRASQRSPLDVPESADSLAAGPASRDAPVPVPATDRPTAGRESDLPASETAPLATPPPPVSGVETPSQGSRPSATTPPPVAAGLPDRRPSANRPAPGASVADHPAGGTAATSELATTRSERAGGTGAPMPDGGAGGEGREQPPLTAAGPAAAARAPAHGVPAPLAEQLRRDAARLSAGERPAPGAPPPPRPATVSPPRAAGPPPAPPKPASTASADAPSTPEAQPPGTPTGGGKPAASWPERPQRSGRPEGER